MTKKVTDQLKPLVEKLEQTIPDDPIGQAKKKAAETWCRHTSEFCLREGKKPWKYILVAHDDVNENMSLEAFV